MNRTTLFEAAKALPETERIELLEQLLETLDPGTDGADEGAFLAELQRRSAEIDSGTAELIPWTELRDEKY